MWVAAAWADVSDVALSIRYRKDVVTLDIAAPVGEHVSPDAPVDLRIRYDGYEAVIGVPGELATHGLPIPDLRGRSVDGLLAVSLCTDAGSACRQVSYSFFGAVPSGARGVAPLSVHVAKPAAPEKVVPHEVSAFRVDPRPVVDRALAVAERDHALVLLDFTAVWCPPCTALSAEVLHAPDADRLLNGFVVAPVDVDVPESWALKDRYHVKGYPTVIAVGPDGAERARLVGYEDRAGFLTFLDHARGAARDVPPATVPPADAGRRAWDAVRRGEDPAPWLAIAGDDPSARLARFVASPTEGELKWVLATWPDRGADWGAAAAGVAANNADRAAVAAALASAVSGQRGIAAADLLDALAELRPEEQRSLHAAAAAVLRSALSGDADRDKGLWTNLAYHQEGAGDVAGAWATLESASAAWPNEMTFDLASGKLLLRAGRPGEAIPRLERALAHSYGDNLLRVSASLAEALVAAGRPAEASALATRSLAQVPAPPAGLDVRTAKYRADLERFLAR